MGSFDRALHDRLVALVEPELELLGVELVDLEVLSGGRRLTLRFAVDRRPEPGQVRPERSIGIDECAQASRHIARVLEAEEAESDEFLGRHTIEVTSPGIFRRLSRPDHFRRYQGEMIKLTLDEEDGDGTRQVRGRIEGTDDDGIEVAVPGGEPERLPFARIRKANLDPDLDFGRNRDR